MICAQPGHLTHSPSGTRLGFSLPAMGVRVFLNQTITGQLSIVQAWWSAGPRHVVAGSRAHPAYLTDEVVDRFLAGVDVELRGFDDEQRRGGVVEEEVLVRLVQLA